MNTQQLNETIAKTLAAWNIPGAAVAVIQGDEEFIQGFGAREAGKPGDVDADTLFAIGSTTKAFTAALIGILVDEGSLGWDDLVIKHIPDFELYDPWITQHVTVRDLLCHRLGLERAQRLYYHQGYTQRDLMRRMKYLRPTAGFRTQFQYANQQFGVAGLLIEAVTGQTWDDFINFHLFLPLGMTRSVSSYDQIGDFTNVASPHAVLDESYPAGVRFLGEPESIPWYKLSHEPAGSIHTSANDLARWLRALLAGGAPVLQPAAFNEITTPQMLMQDLMNSELAPLYALQPATRFWTYGLGWWVMDYHGEKLLMHGGQMPGFNSALAFFPERRMGLAITVNLHQTLAHAALFYAISDILLEKQGRDWSAEFQMVAQSYMAEVKSGVDQFLLGREQLSLSTQKLASFAGTFSNEIFGEILLTVNASGLKIAYGNLVASLEPFKADTFIAHWNLKGLQDDTIVVFSSDAKSLTLVNDRAEYKRIA
ncbi:MAG: serine hydrolase [Chloroflexi bacterium]|nr:serine hydrolase [Chloroflexota bacterium]